MTDKKENKGVEQEFLYRALFKMLVESEDYVFIKDSNLIYKAVSEKVANLAGLQSPAELLGKDDFAVFPSKLAAKYQKDDKQVLNSGKPILGMLEQIPGKTGTVNWSKTWKYPLHDEQGRISGLYGISQDVTYMKKLEATAQQVEKYEALLDSLPSSMAIMHGDGQVLYLDYANKRWFEVQGLSPEAGKKLVGTNALLLVEEEDRPAFAAELHKVEQNKAVDGYVTFHTIDDKGNKHYLNARFSQAFREKDAQYYFVSCTNLDDQKQTEERLADSQLALQEAVSQSDLQFFIYYPAQHYCSFYMTSQRLAGFPANWESFPDDFLRYTKASAEDTREFKAMLHSLDEGAESAGCTVQLCHKNTYYWEKMLLRAERNTVGKPVRYLGYTVNVTKQRKEAEKLRQENVRQKALEGNIIEAFSFNLTKNSEPYFNTKDVAVLHGKLSPELEKRALQLAPALTTATAATRQILLRAAQRIVEPADQDMFIKTCSGSVLSKALAAEGRYKASIQYRRYVGELIRWVETTAEVLTDPESHDFITFYYTKDINDAVINKHIQEQMVRRNYVAISYYDLQVKRLFIKAAIDSDFAGYNGITYEEALKHSLTAVLPDTVPEVRRRLELDTIKAELEQTPEYTAYYTLKERALELPGQPNRQMKSTAFYLSERRNIIVFLVSDVTEIFAQEQDQREKLSAALTAAEQASVAKSEFLSRMSHEIRTPMNAIIGLDAIALQEQGLSAAMEDHLQKIGISARFLLSLINDILDMSRIESGRMLLKHEAFDFEELINSINTILYEQCRNSGLEYECVLKSYTESTYVGDVTKLQQVLVNILGNAVKFTPKGGKIHFMIEQLSRTKDKARLRFEIADTGIGIDEKFLPDLFKPFCQEHPGRTTMYGGSGLGLAISKNIVNMMGGEISVRSLKDVGSIFTVEVELDLSMDAAKRLKLTPPNLQPLFTLIVDDDVVVCQHAQMVLQNAGLRTEWVDSGASAVDKVIAQHKQKQDYDLILLDWQMPDMDGIETAREIRKIVGPDVTIIIMTAFDWTYIEQKARSVGVDMFMKKPVFASSVRQAFENVFLNKKNPLPAAKQSEYDFTGKRVLLVEDNQINAEIAQSILKMKHCEVELAVNGAEAVEAFAAVPVGYYDAILMDVRMPVMDGLEATRTIRAMRKASAKTVPIIAMTANAFQEDVKMSLGAGMNAHLSKPIEPPVLYKTLYNIWQKQKK